MAVQREYSARRTAIIQAYLAGISMKQVASLDIRMLRIFHAVATSGSISRAAQALGITQSAVSQTLTLIDGIVGTSVIDRSRRPIRLTAAGVALNRSAQQIVDDVDRLVAFVREAGQAVLPEMRVGMIDSFAATVGPEIIKRLTKSASQLLVWSGLAYSHAMALLNRQIDLIVTSDPLEDMDGLRRRNIFVEPFVIGVPVAQAAAVREMDLHQLVAAMPLIRFSGRSHFGAMIERHLRRIGVSPKRYLEIDTSDVVMSMVAAGLGWTITTPLCLLQGRSYLPGVAALPFPGAPLSRTILQISREGEYEDMAERFFQASRRALEVQIFPELRSLLPWLGSRLSLS